MLEIGMLWRDDSTKRTLEEKVLRAAAYYRDKYGRLPTVCMVNTAALPDQIQVEQLTVYPSRTVLPQHFWIGVQQ
jgi:hypothetical protein